MAVMPDPPTGGWTNRPAAGAPLTEQDLRGMFRAAEGDMLLPFIVRISSPPLAWNKANARAAAALKRHMTPRQWSSWEARRWCWVDSELGRRYKLLRSWTYNICEYEKCGRAWKPIAHWCLGTPTSVPRADVWLTQLLYLKYSEAAFRITANRQTHGDC